MKIALDAMGGDYAPRNPVEAAVEALELFSHIQHIFLVGDENAINKELHRLGAKENKRLSIYHCTEQIGMEESSVTAVRRKKDSSINRAVDLVKQGKAEAVVSAGHTGAMVTASTMKLRTLPGVLKAGIAAPFPTETNLFVLMDAGANVEAKAEHLTQYAIMGHLYSQKVLKVDRPRVGLLSVGTEEEKGTELTKEAFKSIKQVDGIDFVGNIEGHDLYLHPVEVVVTDGFTGNVVLKTSESLAQAIFSWIKREIYKCPLRKLGGLLAKPAFRAISEKTNYEEYGGCPLLGVNGISVIAHGSSSVKALRNALRVSLEAVELDINGSITEEIQKFKEKMKRSENERENQEEQEVIS